MRGRSMRCQRLRRTTVGGGWRGFLGRGNRNLRRAGGHGTFQNVPLRHRKVDDGGCDFEILRARSPAFRTLRRVAAARRFLRRPLDEARSVDRVHSLQLVPAGEIHDHASRFSLHGLRPGLFDLDITGHGCGAKQVLLSRQQQLGLVGTTADFRRLRLNCGIGS